MGMKRMNGVPSAPAMLDEAAASQRQALFGTRVAPAPDTFSGLAQAEPPRAPGLSEQYNMLMNAAARIKSATDTLYSVNNALGAVGAFNDAGIPAEPGAEGFANRLHGGIDLMHHIASMLETEVSRTASLL